MDLSSANRGQKITADQIREGLVEVLKEDLNALNQEGPASMRQIYLDWSVFFPGSWVEWGSPSRIGQVQGLGPSGELEVRLQEGELLRLYAEDVRVRKHRLTE
jgi:hypothetical protein